MSHQRIHWVTNMHRRYTTVLFLGRPSSPLATNLSNALAQNGALSISLHADSKLISACSPYDCYVLDADFIGDITQTMQRIISLHPKARVLVVSDQYDWQEAVYAFSLGAIDVVRHPMSSVLVRETIKVVMKQHLPYQVQRNASV